jgi:hypothetical protein
MVWRFIGLKSSFQRIHVDRFWKNSRLRAILFRILRDWDMGEMTVIPNGEDGHLSEVQESSSAELLD